MCKTNRDCSLLKDKRQGCRVVIFFFSCFCWLMVILDINHLDMTERLVGVGPRLHGDVVAASGRIGGVAVRGGRSVGAKGLVGVGGLLGSHATGALVLVVVGRLAGAAARADHPEQASSQGESDSQPGGHVDVLAHVALDAVFLEVLVERAGHGRKHRGRSN